jgi:hypothetical protein
MKNEILKLKNVKVLTTLAIVKRIAKHCNSASENVACIAKVLASHPLSEQNKIRAGFYKTAIAQDNGEKQGKVYECTKKMFASALKLLGRVSASKPRGMQTTANVETIRKQAKAKLARQEKALTGLATDCQGLDLILAKALKIAKVSKALTAPELATFSLLLAKVTAKKTPKRKGIETVNSKGQTVHTYTSE